jgi:Ca2+/H+ antiporter
MRSLDEILLGFFIFFTIERSIRLFSNAVIQPAAEKRSSNPETVENWKLLAEVGLLLLACFFVVKFRRVFNKA